MLTASFTHCFFFNEEAVFVPAAYRLAVEASFIYRGVVLHSAPSYTKVERSRETEALSLSLPGVE